MEESIYNLIPKEYVPPPKPKRYHSKYPYDTPPSYSTFGLSTTSKVLGNAAGQFEHFDGAHRSKSASAGFGKVKGTGKPQPSEYIKKKSGASKLPPVTFKASKTHLKPPVPKRDEAPIHGLKSDKNYITANAVDVILKGPKKIPEPENYLKKEQYGKVPRYLARINEQIEEEYKTLKQMRVEEEEEGSKSRYLLSPEEVQELKEGLKKKWEAVNKDYQSITHIGKPDTQGLKRKKENCEKQLAQIEKDLALLDKPYVFVDALS